MGTVPTPASPGAGTVLTSAQTGTWYATQQFLLQPPACRVLTNATLTLTAATPYTVLFGAETLDHVQSGDTEMHSTSTNTDRITIRTAGRYDVSAIAQFAAASGSASVILAKNGTAFVSVAMNTVPTQAVIPIDDTVQCAAGDYITLVVTLTAGGTVSTTWPCSMYAKWVSI